MAAITCSFVRWRRDFIAAKRMEMFYGHLEALLARMVPRSASQYLLQVAAGEVVPGEWGQLHHSVSILFVSLDLEAAQQDGGDPTLLVQELNHVFSVLDTCLEYAPECYKVETICNIYVVSAGVPQHTEHHAQAVAALACRLALELRALRWLSGEAVGWKMGAHCGSVFAGKQGWDVERHETCESMSGAQHWWDRGRCRRARASVAS